METPFSQLFPKSLLSGPVPVAVAVPQDHRLAARTRDAGGLGDADGRPVAAGASQDTEAQLTRLRVENARLAKAETEWQLERENLRRAAAYFAQELK